MNIGELAASLSRMLHFSSGRISIGRALIIVLSLSIIPLIALLCGVLWPALGSGYEDARRQALLAMLGLAAYGAGMVWVLAIVRWRVTQPIGQLTAHADRLRRHDFHEAVVVRGSGDGFSALSQILDEHRRNMLERQAVEGRLQAAITRAEAAKSQFLATMSHEIRSPMNGIAGTIDLLRASPLPGEQQQLVDLLHESATALLGILNDILDFANIEAGAVELSPEPTSTAGLMTSVCETLRHAAAQKGLTFDTSIAADVPLWINVDMLRLRRILVNLVDNAVKFTSSGAVEIKVNRCVDQSGGPVLAFAVSDTGIGMAPETIAHVFESFTQADASTTRNFGGIGLGLSISRRLARLMGGDVEVASKPGDGSIFTLTVPLVDAAQPTATASEAAAVRGAELSPLHVLVAEDLPTNRFIIERQLARLGVQVEMVQNGEEALAALGCGGFDVLITDFHMPDMDGLALTRQIRASEEKQGRPRLPIIGLTADVTPGIRERCQAAGMDEVISKPANMRRLEAALRSVFSKNSDNRSD